MRMNLTWAQVGGILKYTRPAWWRGETPETHHYLMKKPGYYPVSYTHLMVLFPFQIPAGLLSTFIGAPYFIYLLRKQSR